MSGEPTLTPKQEAFALAYVETGSAAEAYRRSYDVKAATRPSGFYVYAIVDEKTQVACYIGKGKGNRMHQHLRAHAAGRLDTIKKRDGIDALLASGAKLKPVCIEDGLSEANAFRFERHLIRSIGHSNLLNSLYGQTTSAERAMHEAKRLIGVLSKVAQQGGCRAVMAQALLLEAYQAYQMAMGKATEEAA